MNAVRRSGCAIAAAVVLAGSPARGQEPQSAPQPPPPPTTKQTITKTTGADQPPPVRQYLPNPADEDWSFLKDPSYRLDFWDRLKYIQFGDGPGYLTLSGEVRYRPEGLRIRGVGERPTTTDNYLLQRYLFGADVHFNKRVRVFAELQSGIINGRLGSPRPSDRNTLDFHQGFVEWTPIAKPGRRMRVKIGRQELAIGSTRLISASPGLNVKRSFDGVTSQFRASTWGMAAAVAELVDVSDGAFDDHPQREQLFWGLAASRKSPRLERGDLGVYYLGIDRRESRYAQGVGEELRHTVGVQWNGSGRRFDLNWDAIVQWGEFADAPIKAWAFATETGFRFPARRWTPRLSLRTDMASGDRDRVDPSLEAFNPLFPGNSYSGLVGLFGPTNLTDVTPSLTFRPRRNLTLGLEAPTYWRTSTGDGIYATDQRVLVPPQAGEGKYVGSNPGVVVVYQATRHLQIQGAITRFLSGGFLDTTFVAKGFGFYSATAQYRF